MTRPEVREDQHGTLTGYTYGCRCDACRLCHSDYMRAYRAANPERERNRDRRNRDQSLWRKANRGRLAGYRRGRDQSKWREANREYLAEYLAEWREANRDGLALKRAAYERRVLAPSVASAHRSRAPWEPHEDALLSRIPSNIAAASALGRSFNSVACRRTFLRRMQPDLERAS